ncbi:FCS-Like Zinc finger 16-like [Malania oleifera]|uniref:FCS-Like Zinc finger 16-like n=1 Tax=Malania oleifera TaxID=397392 RepID=UPI0025ADA7E8|nr:FCS-Like Zinc finger 16-like [Malania oleifera]
MAGRNRMFRSSSMGEVGLFSAIKPIEPPVFRPAAKKKPSAPAASPKADKPRRSVLSFASPPRERKDEWSREGVDERLGMFLRACYHCKRSFSDKDTVFMYGYLRALCSIECREKQIAIVEKDRPPSPESTKIAAERFLRNGLGRRGSDPRTAKLAAAAAAAAASS